MLKHNIRVRNQAEFQHHGLYAWSMKRPVDSRRTDEAKAANLIYSIVSYALNDESEQFQGRLPYLIKRHRSSRKSQAERRLIEQVCDYKRTGTARTGE